MSGPQFRLFAEKILERPDLPIDPKFSNNKARVANRQELVTLITDTLQKESRDHWIEKLTGLGYELQLYMIDWNPSSPLILSVPFGPINNIRQTFAHPQVAARQMITEVEVCPKTLVIKE